MVDLGVAMEDNESGQALLKLVPAEQLRAARDEKERAASEKAARKAEVAAKAQAARLEKLQKGSVAPDQLFRTAEYKEWDEQGLPTLDAKGEPLSKGKRKAAEKDFQKQIKLHDEYKAAKEAGEI